MTIQTELQVDQDAPDFKLKAYPDGEYSLAQFKGKKNVILAFYPKDDTPGCTAENCAFRDDSALFESAQTQVFGVSCDDVKSHEAFSKKFNFTHPLLADVGGSIAKKYGVYQEAKGYSSRKLFLIDKSGKIRKIVDGMPTNLELLDFVKNLK
jgi:peroxiredoxin Q/BCP